jgi:lipooligosaccharide transport system permease protein
VITFRAAQLVVERNIWAYRRQWFVFASGFAEPILYLLSIGIGVGELVGTLEHAGQAVTYREFVAPGMLAAAAMNGAVFDTTFNFFIKLKYQGVYDAMLATPLTPTSVALGEVGWSLLRGGLYAAAFLVTMLLMGLVASWWAVLAVPAAILIGFAFAGAGLGGTSYMRSWTDFDLVALVLLPQFLFSATFFPLAEYPGWLQWVVRLTPLYQGVALERSLILGSVGWTTVLQALYLLAMGAVGVRIASRRLARLLTA